MEAQRLGPEPVRSTSRAPAGFMGKRVAESGDRGSRFALTATVSAAGTDGMMKG